MVAAVGAAAQPDSEAPPAIEAVAKPSRDVTFSFTRPGRVDRILVKAGQPVAAGEVLVQLDDAVERERVARLKQEADETLHVDAAEANMKLKEVVLERKENGFKNGVVTVLELEEARVDATIGKLSYDLAKFNREMAGREHQEALLDVERMMLTSNIDGIVETLYIEEGESVDRMAEVVRVVDIDPLWIDVPTPLELAQTLQPGQAADVAFCSAREQAEPSPEVGRIIHIGAVADAASDTLIVRVELPNPTASPAGQRVEVRYRPGAAKADTPTDRNEPDTETAETDLPSAAPQTAALNEGPQEPPESE